jgi:predicted homoserine dehydrogenase-like protein
VNYTRIFQAAEPIKAGLIGVGAFGGSFLFQARAVARLAVPVVCDRDVAMAHQVCLIRPKVDLVARTTAPLKAGQRLSMLKDHAITGISPELAPAAPIGPENPIPFYLATGNSLKVDVPAGTLLTYGMIDHDPSSTLWQLKQLQDRRFLEQGNV